MKRSLKLINDGAQTCWCSKPATRAASSVERFAVEQGLSAAEISGIGAFSDTPITWHRVTDLPDYVYFNHKIHIARGVGCESCCHGTIQDMP
jgi:hypothetical protein